MDSLDINKKQATSFKRLPKKDLERVRNVTLMARDLRRCTATLLKCPNLQGLELRWNQDAIVFPIQVCTQLPKLRVLRMEARGYQIPNDIQKAQNLEELAFNYAHFQTIPDVIGKLPKLLCLELRGNQLSQLPDSFKHLTQLQSLDLTRNNFESLPPVIHQFKNLKELYLDQEVLKNLSQQDQAFLDKVPYVFMHDLDSRDYELKAILKAAPIEEKRFSFRAAMLNALAGNDKEAQEQTMLEDLIAATNIQKSELLRMKVLRYFPKHFSKEVKDALKKDAHITILGSITMHKTELKKRLKSHKIKYSNKITEQTTHILLGQLPKGNYLEAIENGAYAISEHCIQLFFDEEEQPFLLQKGEEQVHYEERLIELLKSKQTENIQLVLGMVKENGLPPNLVKYLLIAHSYLSDFWGYKDPDKLFQSLSRVVKQHVSAEVAKQIKYTSAGLWQGHPAAMEFYAKHLKMTPLELALLICSWRGDSASFIEFFIDAAPRSLLAKELQKRIKAKALKLHYRSYGEEKELPLAFCDLTDLEELNINSYPITYLPSEFAQLQTLKIFKANYVKFKQFPTALLTISNLEEVYLEHCKLPNLPKQIGQLQNLRKVNLAYNNISELPSSFFELKALEDINLSHNNISLLDIERLFKLLKLKRLVFYTRSIPKKQHMDFAEQIQKLYPDCDYVY
ncbi:MAG: hypothetical protein GY810_06895 [Aureispira sp.]|nr:hypothetical protein [Aureispira sp.]